MTTMQRLAIVDAERALKAYAPGGMTNLENIRSNITSLITDLMHLCDNHGLDFENALEIARDMHKEDCRDPRESFFCFEPGVKPVNTISTCDVWMICPSCIGIFETADDRDFHGCRGNGHAYDSGAYCVAVWVKQV